jgi:ribosomal protein L11 methyltransferase
VDIDEWSVNNAKENMVANSCRHIQILRGDIDVVPVMKYNIILANINRNILLEYMDSFRSLLSQEGSLVLSGIMDQDLESIRLKAGKTGFRELSSSNEKAWQCLHFYKV